MGQRMNDDGERGGLGTENDGECRAHWPSKLHLLADIRVLKALVSINPPPHTLVL